MLRREINIRSVPRSYAVDLSAYTCRGFGVEFDRAMRDVPVAGIDREQTHSMVRLCDETGPLLYGSGFSPRRIRYRPGSRPELESLAAELPRAPMQWVRQTVLHPNFSTHVPPDRAMTEEQLIGSGRGWCNEQCRVFIALCEVMEVPARLCFLFHANGRTGHTATEVWTGDKWGVHDVTFGVQITLADGSPADARDLRGPHRSLAHAAYEQPLRDYYRKSNPPPFDLTRGGDLFEQVGICSYLTKGVEAVE